MGKAGVLIDCAPLATRSYSTMVRVRDGETIAGPKRSGRSTALRVAALSLLDAGTRVLLVTPRPSPLASLASHPGVTPSTLASSTMNSSAPWSTVKRQPPW